MTATGRELIEVCSRQFLATNRLRGYSEGQGRQGGKITRLQGELSALFNQLQGSAAEDFVSYLQNFFSLFTSLAAFDIADADQQKAHDERLARIFDYLGTLNLLKTSGKNIVEFCASSQLFTFIADIVGHNSINTDMGGNTAEDAYGFGAKVFLRNTLLGTNLLNFHLDVNDLTAACSIPWFKDGVDVFAAHGTFINAGKHTEGRETESEMKRSISEVMRFLDPCVHALQKRQGMLSLRHVVLFDGYGTEAKADLSRMLGENIKTAFNASTILCGEDPFPSPWAWAHSGKFTYALVIRC